MKSKLEEKQNELLNMYRTWVNELKDTGFYDKEKNSKYKYSNPYYVSIPNEWFESKHRIMIVGKEGYGSWGCGRRESEGYNEKPWDIDAIEEIQMYNYEQTLMQVSPNNLPEERRKLYKVIPSAFWRRFKRIYDLGDNISCIWNNIDKVHHLMEPSKSRENTCPLEHEEETILHSTKTHVLEEEIKILEPTIVIFFSWYKISLKNELSDIFNMLYKGEKSYNHSERETKPDIIEDKRGMKYVFAYHPNHQHKTYETLICNTIKRLCDYD